MRLDMFRLRGPVVAAALLALTSGMAYSQSKPEEEPAWAKGRPRTESAMKMAPVPAFPIPTPAAELPVGKMKVPAGFQVEVWADGVLDARALREGDKGTVFVSSLFVANKVYAITDEAGQRKVRTIVDKLPLATGLEYHQGALYVATPKQLLRLDDIESKLDNPPEPVVVTDQFPGDEHHGWKYLRVGPDGKMYYPVGAPCNICDVSDRHARIFRVNLDGSGHETVAMGVRNSVGFDFHPTTGELWFTDNQRDWLSEDLPEDELNRVTQPGKQHFGYPFCHQGTFADPEFGWGTDCSKYEKPAALLGPHAAPLGMTFYDGKMFPEKYRNAIFVSRHGPWNRTIKYADVAAVFLDSSGNVTGIEPFLSGLVENNQYLARPADVMVMKDGSLLVSDDHNGAIYRVSYKP
jgi:glucose/arabinose dehydrogenase